MKKKKFSFGGVANVLRGFHAPRNSDPDERAVNSMKQHYEEYLEWSSKSEKQRSKDKKNFHWSLFEANDPSKPCEIEFQLHFFSKTAAEQAASRLRAEGFVDVTVAKWENDAKPSGLGRDPNVGEEIWGCYFSKIMIPELSALQDIRRKFESIATREGGDYTYCSIQRNRERTSPLI